MARRETMADAEMDRSPSVLFAAEALKCEEAERKCTAAGSTSRTGGAALAQEAGARV